MRDTGLPTKLNVCGTEYEINSDFRDVINICFAYNDPEITPQAANYITVYLLYKCDIEELPDYGEALKKAVWFLDGGKDYSKQPQSSPKLFDWVQDYDFIISAVDQSVKTAETVLELPYMHWWTFIRKLSERKETRLDNIIGIRDKINRHQKLEKWESQMLRENEDVILFRNKKLDEFEKEMWGDI